MASGNLLNITAIPSNNNNTNNNNNNNINFFNTSNNIFNNPFNLGNKPDEDIPGELPLLQLQSKYSINSQMNPVRGLEMKRMISLNQEGAAEPYIDLNSNIIYNYNNNNTNTNNQQQSQQQQPQLVLQPSFMLELNGHTSNTQNQPSALSYYQNFDVLAQQQQQQMNNHVNTSNIFVNSNNNNNNTNTINNNSNSNISNTAIQPNFFGNLFPNGTQTSNNNNNHNNNNSNLIFKNPDLLSSSASIPIKNTLTYQTATTGFQPAIRQQQQQQQHQQSQFSFINNQQNQTQQQQQPNMFPMFKEKKEEFDNDQVQALHSFANSANQQISQQQFYQLQAQQQQQQYNPNPMSFQQQQQQQFQIQYQQQQQQLQQQLQQHIAMNQAPHQQFINMDEAEYLDGARSHAGADDEQDDFGNIHEGLGLHHHNNNHFHRITHNNNNNHIQHANHNGNLHGNNHNNNLPHHEQQNQQQNENDSNDEAAYEAYSNNESHTRHKTEWPTRQKGQIKYQQCRHRNIFKNFGNIFRKFVSFHPHFTEKALEGLQKNQDHLKLFQKWLKKDIRLENKKDFIEGWTVWKDEETLTRQFKIILKELSKDFFEDYILIYLLNSKLQDLEIHLRSIGPCLAAINQPTVLYKFRPI